MPTPISFERTFMDEPSLSIGNWSGTVGYRAVFADADVGTLTSSDAIADTHCPKLWATSHPENPYAFCSDLRAVRNQEVQTVIDIVATFETGMSQVDSKGKPLDKNPLKHPLGVDWGTWTFTDALKWWKPYERVGGKWQPQTNVFAGLQTLATTTAGEQLQGSTTHSYRELQCTKFVTKANDVFAEGGDWVNDSKVTIEGHTFEKMTLLASTVNFKKVEIREGVLGREMSFVLRHKPDTWLLRYPNIGYHQLAYHVVPGANGKADLKLGYGPIQVGIPSQPTSQPVPLLNMPGRLQVINTNQQPQTPVAAAAFPFADYNQIPVWGPSNAPQGYEGAGVTNGDFYHGHAHPAYLRYNDKGDLIEGTNLTPADIARIYEENQIAGMVRPLLDFNQYFPLK
jgi:hypothetical protein